MVIVHAEQGKDDDDDETNGKSVISSNNGQENIQTGNFSEFEKEWF